MLIRIAFCHVSENLSLRYLFLRYYHKHIFLFSILKLHVTSSQFCLYLPNIYHFTYTFSNTHTEAHTQTHIYNQHTRGMAPTMHRSLVERGRRKALQRPCKRRNSDARSAIVAPRFTVHARATAADCCCLRTLPSSAASDIPTTCGRKILFKSSCPQGRGALPARDSG